MQIHNYMAFGHVRVQHAQESQGSDSGNAKHSIERPN